MLETVTVPPELEPLFARSERFVGDYFGSLHTDPAQGTIEVGGERYILVRAASMSVEFFRTIQRLYSDQGEQPARTVARSLLYDLAYAIGAADARAFHEQLDLHEPLARLSAGPIHFAHTGWAHVAIHPASRPVADEHFRLIYDHPYSFEASAWQASDLSADFPVCVMNAGYSSGWCTESFGLPLVATEIACQAMGDDRCRFVMATPARIEEEVVTYLSERPALARAATRYEIPGFFSRKQAEDELRQREEQYRSIFESASDAILIVEGDGRVIAANPAAEQLYGREAATLLATTLRDLTALTAYPALAAVIASCSGPVAGEALAVGGDGRVFEIEYHAAPFGVQRQPHVLMLVNDISARKRVEAERLRLQEQLVRQNERLRAELSLARTVQQSLLPPRPPWPPERLVIARHSRQASTVGHDFYSYVAQADGGLLVTVGTVAATGVEAALLIALAVSVIESQAHLTPLPTDLLQAVQSRLTEQLRACETFLSLLVARVEPQQKLLRLANAGMAAPLLLRQAAPPEEVELAGTPLGIVGGEIYREARLALAPGDGLLLLSAGIVAARAPHGELFGYQRLRDAAAGLAAASPDVFIIRLAEQVAAFTQGAEQKVDQTALLVHVPFSATDVVGRGLGRK